LIEGEGKVSLNSIREDTKHLKEWDINSYHHEQWVTTSEGKEMCNIILNLIDYISELEEKIEELDELNEKIKKYL
jgi:hypothetical protein